MAAQHLLLHKVKITNSNRRGEHHEHMPTLIQAHKFSDTNVYMALVHLKKSIFVGANQSELAARISISVARRQLYYLIIDNERERSDLPSINEVDSSPSCISNEGSDFAKTEEEILNLLNGVMFDFDPLSKEASDSSIDQSDLQPHASDAPELDRGKVLRS